MALASLTRVTPEGVEDPPIHPFTTLLPLVANVKDVTRVMRTRVLGRGRDLRGRVAL